MPVYTSDITARRQGIDVTKRIAMEFPEESAFMVMLMRSKRLMANHWNLVWWDDRPGGWWTQINNAVGYNNAATDLIVDDSTIFAAKDMLKVARTGEQMLITAVDHDTKTLTVVREYGTTGKAALLDDDWVMLLANAMEEFSTVPAAKISQPVERENYVQTYRTPFDESDLSAVSDIVTSESERKRLRRLKLLEHRMGLERTIIFGEKKKDTNNKRFTCGGLLNFITSNSYDAGGLLTEKKWNDFTKMGFKYGSKSKVLVCGPTVGSLINDFAASKIQTNSGQTTYGLKLNYIQTFHGRVYIVPSQTFEHDYADMGVLCDMRHIRFRPVKGRDTKLFTDIQSKDADGWRDEYRTKFSLQVEVEKCHSIIKNCGS
ncbi:MAG: DUF5309 domain-containing protein [Bacteroidales bacterium]|nr:DUF5309 domain-containing protein [Bacteroidales bacterium]